MFVAIIFINFEGTKVVNNDQGHMMVETLFQEIIKNWNIDQRMLLVETIFHRCLWESQ